MRVFLSLVLVVALIAGAVLGGAWWEERYFSQAGPSPSGQTLIITAGSGLNAIAGALARAGVVENALFFRLGVLRRGHGAQLKAGEYAFPAHASEAQIMDMLIAHRVVGHRV